MPDTVEVTADNVGNAPIPTKSHSFVGKSSAGRRTRKRSKIAAEAAAAISETIASQE